MVSGRDGEERGEVVRADKSDGEGSGEMVQFGGERDSRRWSREWEGEKENRDEGRKEERVRGERFSCSISTCKQ